MTDRLNLTFLTLTLTVNLWLARLEAKAAPAAEAESRTGAPLQRQDKAKPHFYKEQAGDLPNFHAVHPYLYRGGEPTVAGLRRLKQMGVTKIIDLRGHPGQVAAEAYQASQLGMEPINLPMSSKAPTDQQVRTFLKTVQEARDHPAGGKVFVHCAHGSDRTGCLVGIWRVVKDGWSFDQAFAEMRKYYFSPKFSQLSSTVMRYGAQRPVGATGGGEAAP